MKLSLEMVNRRIEGKEVNSQIFVYGHFTFQAPEDLVQRNAFSYQEIESLYRRCFCQQETSFERTLVQVLVACHERYNWLYVWR
jgi:hypothetical protein